MLQIPGEDEYYIAYHRFFMPLGFFSDGTGHHRQTCIDKVTFGEDGLMEVVIPTLEGPAVRILPEAALPTPEPTAAPTEIPASPTEVPVQPTESPAEPTNAPENPGTQDVGGNGGAVTWLVVVAIILIAGTGVFVLLRKKK